MRWILALAVLVVAISASIAASAITSQSRIETQMPGSSLKWIHIAEHEWERKEFDLDKYRVLVVEEENSVTVILRGLNEPKGTLGSIGPDPGYEVEISKKTYKVLRSNYVR
jgi:hypothetical protein